MRKRAIVSLAAMLLLSVTASAQRKLHLSLETQYIFDNHEFDASGRQYIPSETFHFFRFTPTLNWRFADDEKWSHTVNIGLDFLKETGLHYDGLMDTLYEMPLYLSSHYEYEGRDFCSAFGIYPRRMMEGYYSELIFSEETLQSDFNLEGMFFKYRKSNFYSEIGLDWMGKYGTAVKERFQVFSAGSWKLFSFLSLGWAGSFYHYAGSVQAPGVVDNHVLEPYMLIDASQYLPFNELSVRVSGFYGYQNDRMRQTLVQPKGFEVGLKARWKSLVLNNTMSETDNFLEFYGLTDTGGNPYGDMLYFGSKFYNGFYDRLELAWVPRITKKLDAKLSLRFHFNDADGFLGSEQRLSIYYTL